MLRKNFPGRKQERREAALQRMIDEHIVPTDVILLKTQAAVEANVGAHNVRTKKGRSANRA